MVCTAPGPTRAQVVFGSSAKSDASGNAPTDCSAFA